MENDTNDFLYRSIIVVLMIAAGSFVYLPYNEKFANGNSKTKSKVQSLSNCFASGLLLGMSLIHILPETSDKYNDFMKDEEETHVESADEHDHEHSIPVPFILFLCGFLFMMLMDQVVFKKVEHDKYEETQQTS